MTVDIQQPQRYDFIRNSLNAGNYFFDAPPIHYHWQME